ncbi:MAG: DNA methylase N-4 [Alphaproteobacteria bacterium]|nr:MAG: DNA methylase N-4 [Alphaproteobacteria bacterium]
MADNSNHLQIEMVPHGSIHPNPQNPRRHNRKQRGQMKSSLRRFGFKGALIVDKETGMILAGNALWEAAGELGMDEVPVIRASFATEADRRAFILAHNKLADLSSFDAEIVAEELKFLFDSGYDFEVTGFTTNDLDFSIVSEPEPNEIIELPDPNARAVSRLGDLWHVGPHRILCGNSLDTVSYEALLADELADMIFSDPPYGVRINGHVSGLGKIRHREFEMMSGEQSPAELIAFFRRIFRNCVQFSRAASIHYHCIDWRHARQMQDAADGVYTEFKQLVVWDKGSGAMGAFYRSQHELILVFKSGRGRHTNNFELGQQRYRTNIWRYDGAAQFRKGRQEDLEAHPSVKSTAMVIDAIRDCSNTGDLILDPFAGSGTTAAAAHHAGRRCATVEIDPLYVDTALKRLCKVTGRPAIHADGRTFDEVAADRASEEATDV